MKKLLLLFIITLTISSCAPTIFYQMHEVKSDQTKFYGDVYKYENAQLKIVYNLWSRNGNAGFTIFNKTDSTIYLNLNESYFIVNGIANDYFQGKVVSKSNSVSLGSSYSYIYSNTYIDLNAQIPTHSNTISGKNKSSSSKNSTISYKEKKVISIPPKSGKSINKFEITNVLYRDCYLFRFPKKNWDLRKKSFNKENTPLKFSNILSYSFSKKLNNPKTINNEFWVTEIANFTLNNFTEYRSPEFCDEKLRESVKYYTKYKKNRYFIKYKKSSYVEFIH